MIKKFRKLTAALAITIGLFCGAAHAGPCEYQYRFDINDCSAMYQAIINLYDNISGANIELARCQGESEANLVYCQAVLGEGGGY